MKLRRWIFQGLGYLIGFFPGCFFSAVPLIITVALIWWFIVSAIQFAVGS